MKKAATIPFFFGLLSSSLLLASEYGSIKAGPFSIGGAVRVNYVQDSQDIDTQNASKGSQGIFDLDTARINIDFNYDSFIGKFEYRWYPGFDSVENGTNYSFIHTAWLGYKLNEKNHIEAGITRVPFGPGAYGVSNSWFFDQHYYVGLTDDMDLGMKFTSQSIKNLTIDLAYFYGAEDDGIGKGGESTRYGYDVVDDFNERDQLNLRVVYTQSIGESSNDFGFSLLYSELESKIASVDDGERFAASAHMVNRYKNFTLKTQLTRYEMSVDKNNDGSDDALVTMGGFNYGEGVASKAWLPSASLSYKIETPSISWLDYALPYIEYSNIIKDESSFNDSEMIMIGSAWARGNWYIYSDLALANGNYFVGPYTSSDGGTNNFGANSGDDMEYRFNVNFGYYF
ncbi:hypothetical protein [Sulfurimonas xiamenensis]|uniref:Phosphate-selective porin O and P n=1 Tax=Sulfurimonas xiamenensis TaxID=2590021 RepID=A0AAJ4DMG3_9BACT|nr:hypothetical protein [Sulfurimonas xiamenensis]QFR43000.1 hypothetical protein FJR47_03400 [Sulfurimonas xiamenensis]